MLAQYEVDDEAFSAEGYKVKGWSGIAFYVLGHELEVTEDAEWSGIYQRTGKLVVMMIGDDRHFVVDAEDVEPLGNKEYCRSCGQIGCTCNIYD